MRDQAGISERCTTAPPTKKVERSPKASARIPPRMAPIGIEPPPMNRYMLFTRPNSWSGIMRWRSDTVITFHVTMNTPDSTDGAATAHAAVWCQPRGLLTSARCPCC